MKEFEESGYDVQYRILNSANYGVPQKRERVIIVGFRKDLNVNFSFPDVEIEDENNFAPLKRSLRKKWMKNIFLANVL